ncbi:MAG: sialidase family protein [Candidatus Latescibacterota bacterium]|nr:sialidase family protein [Candidatus Latescibacterota bacterium]
MKTLLSQQEIWTSGEAGYNTYRIPALTVSASGTVLALCEGRKHSRSDAGTIELLLRRSTDSGVNWEPVQVVVAEAEMTCGNPCPVVDRTTGRIHLLFCKNLGNGPESMICEGEAPRTVWYACSDDDGLNWSEPMEITATTKREFWTWYATGPGHGIQLESGRLVIPCDHMVGENLDRATDPYHSHVIISDDNGASWSIGGIVPEGTNECCIIEAADGSLYINCRNYRGEKRRAAARSTDAGESFPERYWEDGLPEPICQGSMVTHTADSSASNRVLFANPASQEERAALTLRLSEDGGRSWAQSRCLYKGPSAYSDLAVAPDGMALCLYERGADDPYEHLTLARIHPDWICESD